MSEPLKNTIKNTLKEDALEEVKQENKPKKEKAKKESTSTAPSAEKKYNFVQKINSYFTFLKNEQFQRVFGLTLLLFAVFLSIAFTSYIFTGSIDQDKVLGDLFSPDVVVTNWLGKLGALLAHIFIYKWFGIASYFFSFVSFVLGLRLTFNIPFLNIKKVYIYCLFALLFLSLSLSYLFKEPRWPGRPLARDFLD